MTPNRRSIVVAATASTREWLRSKILFRDERVQVSCPGKDERPLATFRLGLCPLSPDTISTAGHRGSEADQSHSKSFELRRDPGTDKLSGAGSKDVLFA